MEPKFAPPVVGTSLQQPLSGKALNLWNESSSHNALNRQRPCNSCRPKATALQQICSEGLPKEFSLYV
jgi:hypothetical protein